MVQIPRLPSVDVQTGQVVPVQAPQVRPMQDFSAEQIGQLGEGMMRAGRGAVRYAAYQQRQKEIEDAENAENIAMQSDMAFRDHLDNELNPENGYRSKAGQEAIDGYKPLLENAAKKAQEIEDNLDSDLAKKMFRREANRKLMAFKADASQHYYNKRQTFRVGLMQAEADAAKGDATRYLNTFDADPSEVPDEYKTLMVDKDGNPRQITPYQFNLEKFQAYLRRAGTEANLDNVQIESAVKKATSEMHVQSLEALTNQDPERAQKYFDTYKDGINSALHADISKGIERAGLEKFARGYADEVSGLIKSQFPNLGKTTALENSLKLVDADKSITDDQAKAIKQTIIQNAQRDEALEKGKKVDTMQAFEQWASSPEVTANTQLQFSDLPKEWLDQLESSGLTQHYQDWWDEGRQYVTRPGMYSALLSKNDSYWLGLKTEADVHRAWRSQLNNDHFGLALSSWSKAHGRATATQNSALTDAQSIKFAYEDVLKSYGLTRENVAERLKANNEQSKSWLLSDDSFDRHVREQFVSTRNSMNRDLTPEHKEEIIKRIKADSTTILKASANGDQKILIPSVLISPSKLRNAENLYSRSAYVSVNKDPDDPNSPRVDVPYLKVVRAMTWTPGNEETKTPGSSSDPDVRAADAEGFFEEGTGDQEYSDPARKIRAEAVLDQVARAKIEAVRTYNAGDRMGLPPDLGVQWFARQIVDAEANYDKQVQVRRDAYRASTSFPVTSKASAEIDLNPELARVSSRTELNKFQSILDRAHNNNGVASEQDQAEVNVMFPPPSWISQSIPVVAEISTDAARDRLMAYGKAFSNDPVALKILDTAWKRAGWEEAAISEADLGKGLVGLGTRKLGPMPFTPYTSMIKNLRWTASNVLNRSNALISIPNASALTGITPTELNKIFSDDNKPYGSIPADLLFREMSRRKLIKEEDVEGKKFYVLDKAATFWDTADDYSDDRYRVPAVTLTRK